MEASLWKILTKLIVNVKKKKKKEEEEEEAWGKAFPNLTILKMYMALLMLGNKIFLHHK